MTGPEAMLSGWIEVVGGNDVLWGHDGERMAPSGFSRPKVHDQLDSLLDSCHEGWREFGEWPSDEPTIVNGPELIDEKVGATAQATGGS